MGGERFLATVHDVNTVHPAAAGEFTTVGWPGFIGVFSGIAPRRFAVTLNAVISDEPLQAASPVVFLLRQVLEEAPDFQSALRTLKESTVSIGFAAIADWYPGRRNGCHRADTVSC